MQVRKRLKGEQLIIGTLEMDCQILIVTRQCRSMPLLLTGPKTPANSRIKFLRLLPARLLQRRHYILEDEESKKTAVLSLMEDKSHKIRQRQPSHLQDPRVWIGVRKQASSATSPVQNQNLSLNCMTLNRSARARLRINRQRRRCLPVDPSKSRRHLLLME
jgi:hypothetical protein